MKIKYLNIVMAMLVISGCSVSRKYVRRVDNISMRLKDIQQTLSPVSRDGKELNRSLLSSPDAGKEGFISVLDRMGSEVSDMKIKQENIMKAFKSVRCPSFPLVPSSISGLLKEYHDRLYSLLDSLGGGGDKYPVDSDLPIRIEVKGKIEYVTLRDVQKYGNFLKSTEQANGYLDCLDCLVRAYKFKLLAKNFYVYDIKPYSYSDAQKKIISSYMIEKKEIEKDAIEKDYLTALKRKIFYYEEQIKTALSGLIESRSSINTFLR